MVWQYQDKPGQQDRVQYSQITITHCRTNYSAATIFYLQCA